MVSRIKKYKWLTMKFKPSELLPWDPKDRLLEKYEMWGGHGDIPEDMIDDALRYLPEQVSSRAAYDWNGRVDLSAGLVQVPMIGFEDLGHQKVELTKQGLVEADEDSTDAMDRLQLKATVASTVRKWADISLLYSAGGLVDAVAIRQQRGMKEKR